MRYICKRCGSKNVKIKLTNFGIIKTCEKCNNFEASTLKETLRFKYALDRK